MVQIPDVPGAGHRVGRGCGEALRRRGVAPAALWLRPVTCDRLQLSRLSPVIGDGTQTGIVSCANFCSPALLLPLAAAGSASTGPQGHLHAECAGSHRALFAGDPRRQDDLSRRPDRDRSENERVEERHDRGSRPSSCWKICRPCWPPKDSAWSISSRPSVFLKDLNEFGKMNGVYATFFKSNPPARATVEVARLPRDVKVEIAGDRGRAVVRVRYSLRSSPRKRGPRVLAMTGFPLARE